MARPDKPSKRLTGKEREGETLFMFNCREEEKRRVLRDDEPVL
jgi:hypothetical protein